MNWREHLLDYFNFTRKDRIGILVITGLMALVFSLPRIIKKTNTTSPAAVDTSWIAVARSLERRDSAAENLDPGFVYDRPVRRKDQSSTDLFFFDPNHISKQDWLKLGLKERTIQTIQNYLNKGGAFRRPEDLQKVYGLRNKDYDRLAPYIRIKRNPELNADFPKTEKEYSRKTYSSSSKTYIPIDINMADTSAFIALPGIGSKLALRIVNFREKLGGFYSVNQVGETFGLADSVFQKIRPYLELTTQQIRKININNATLDELKAHPYCHYTIANAIISFRIQHGPFRQIDELKNIVVVTQDIYEKLNPYLEL